MMHVTTGGSDNHMHPETNPVGIRTRSVTISLRAVSEAPASEDLRIQNTVYGRFRYSGLKEASLRGYGFCIGLVRFCRLSGLPLRTVQQGCSVG